VTLKLNPHRLRTRQRPAPPDWNRIVLDYRQPLPRPKVRGIVIDAHTHLLAARHAKAGSRRRRILGLMRM